MAPLAPALLALALVPALLEDPLPNRPGHVPSTADPFAAPRPPPAPPAADAAPPPAPAAAPPARAAPPAPAAARAAAAPPSGAAAPAEGAPAGRPAPGGGPAPSFLGGAALGEGGMAAFAQAGYPVLGAAWAQGLGPADDAGALLRLDWTTSEMTVAGLWRHELSRTFSSWLGFRLGAGLWADFGTTWVWAGNGSNVGLQVAPGVAWSTLGAGPGLLTFSLDAPITWAWQRGMGVALAPELAVAYEVPVTREVSVGGRAVLWWRWAGGSADVPGLDATIRGAGVATVSWRAF